MQSSTSSRPQLRVKQSKDNADNRRVRPTTILPLLILGALLAFPAASWGCEEPVYDAATATYTVHVGADDTNGVVGFIHPSSAYGHGSIRLGNCRVSDLPDYRHVVINAERAVRISAGAAVDFAALGGTIDVSGASKGLELAMGSVSARAYNMKVADDGLDLNGDGVTDILMGGASMSLLEVEGSPRADRLDLRRLSDGAWGRDAHIEYSGSGVGRDRRWLWVGDNALKVEASTARWPLWLSVSGSKAADVTTGNGSDHLVMGSGNDIVRSGFGSDYVNGRAGNDRIGEGGVGLPMKLIKSSRMRYFGGPGNDVIAFLAYHSVISGGPGKDKLGFSGARDRIFGGTGNDYIHQTNGGPHYINAGPGRDYLEIYMKHTLNRLATLLCGTGSDTINYARPGARSCEHTTYSN